MFGHACEHVAGTCIGMCVDMHTGMRAGTCTDMHTGVCVDTYAHLPNLLVYDEPAFAAVFLDQHVGQRCAVCPKLIFRDPS